jgi:signal transduction histidine kinase
MTGKIKEIEHLYDDVRKYSYELENAKKQIENYSQQVENITLLKERQRISEEIHDTIGHRLTALLMQMEAGTRLLKENNQTGRDLLYMSVENLRETIDVLRQTVRSIKPKVYRNLLFSIEELIKRFKKETGINIDFEVNGTAFKLYPGVEMVLYKNAQEAITNAVRHGKSKNISILLQYEENNVALTVSNDGISCEYIKKGMGITSMEERLKFVGGNLYINHKNGFSIVSSIPVKGVS